MEIFIYITIGLILVIIIILLYLSLGNNDTPANKFDGKYVHLLIKYSGIGASDKEGKSSMGKQEIMDFLATSGVIHQVMHKKILDEKIISNPFMSLIKEKIMGWTYSLVGYRFYFIYNGDKISVYASVPEFTVDSFSAAIMSCTEGSHIEQISDEEMLEVMNKVIGENNTITLRLLPSSKSYSETFKDYEEITGFPLTIVLTNLLKCQSPTMIQYNITPIPSNYIRYQIMKKSKKEANQKKGFLQTESQQQGAAQRKGDEEGSKRVNSVFFKSYIDIIGKESDTYTCASSFSQFEKGFAKFNKIKLQTVNPKLEVPQ